MTDEEIKGKIARIAMMTLLAVTAEKNKKLSLFKESVLLIREINMELESEGKCLCCLCLTITEFDKEQSQLSKIAYEAVYPNTPEEEKTWCCDNCAEQFKDILKQRGLY